MLSLAYGPNYVIDGTTVLLPQVKQRERLQTSKAAMQKR
jgi:hypothetical protein